MPPVPQSVFPGDSEMAALCRAFDWSSTRLGSVETWPGSLQTTVGIVLTSRNPMFLWWGDDLVQFYNDAYRPSLGQGDQHPRALGARGREFWTHIWSVIGPQIEQVKSGGEATWYEDQYLPIERNGGIEDVWWTYSYSPVRSETGTIDGVLVVCQETTKRVASITERDRLIAELKVERARLNDVFKQAPTFLAVLRGPEHNFDRANDAYYQLVGHRGIVGRPVLEAIPEVRDQGFVELLDGVLATGRPYVGREAPITLARTPGAPAEQRYVDFVYLPLVEASSDGESSIVGVIAHGTDVTDHVIARAEIERLLGVSEAARADAEAANRAKSEFLTVMSHELRTPLNAIDGYAELMEMGIRGPVTDEQREDLIRIRKSQRHLLGLINDVLNFARVEASTVQYEIETVYVDEAIRTCEALTAPQRRAKRLQFSYEGCDPACTVTADRERLRQIVLNLLTNAIKFTPEDGRITIRCVQELKRISIRVSDTGVGIASDQAERIFEPFVQVHAGLTRTQEGIGLGLAISRKLALAMGGDLTLESAPAAGSTFILVLPR